MILSFINIGICFALGFQHFPWDLANVNEWKIMFDPSIIFDACYALENISMTIIIHEQSHVYSMYTLENISILHSNEFCYH